MVRPRSGVPPRKPHCDCRCGDAGARPLRPRSNRPSYITTRRSHTASNSSMSRTPTHTAAGARRSRSNCWVSSGVGDVQARWVSGHDERRGPIQGAGEHDTRISPDSSATLGARRQSSGRSPSAAWFGTRRISNRRRGHAPGGPPSKQCARARQIRQRCPRRSPVPDHPRRRWPSPPAAPGHARCPMDTCT